LVHGESKAERIAIRKIAEEAIIPGEPPKPYAVPDLANEVHYGRPSELTFNGFRSAKIEFRLPDYEPSAAFPLFAVEVVRFLAIGTALLWGFAQLSQT
jgi:hypothetical protein